MIVGPCIITESVRICSCYLKWRNVSFGVLQETCSMQLYIWVLTARINLDEICWNTDKSWCKKWDNNSETTNMFGKSLNVRTYILNIWWFQLSRYWLEKSYCAAGWGAGGILDCYVRRFHSAIINQPTGGYNNLEIVLSSEPRIVCNQAVIQLFSSSDYSQVQLTVFLRRRLQLWTEYVTSTADNNCCIEQNAVRIYDWKRGNYEMMSQYSY